MAKPKAVHKLLIRGENKPRLATEGKEAKVNFFIKNIGNHTFPGGELTILFFPVALGDKAGFKETLNITQKIEPNTETFVGSGGIIPIASGYTMFCILSATTKDNFPIIIWEKNNKQCYPNEGREAQVFHSIRAQTHEEISQRQAVYLAIISLVLVVVFEAISLVLDWFQYLHPYP